MKQDIEMLGNAEYIDVLFDLVNKSNDLDEIPVGAIVIHNNKIIGKGYNNRQSEYSVCGHAEINAIIEAENSIKDWRLNGCILLTTLFPCELCQKAIEESRVDEVYYIFDGKNMNDNKYKKLDINNNKKVEKMKKIFDDFFIKLR